MFIPATTLSSCSACLIALPELLLRQRSVLLLLLATLITACDWVDSTGAQRSSDVPVITALEQGNVLDLIEGEGQLLDPNESVDPLGEVVSYRWSNQPTESGNLSDCQLTNGFNAEFVEDNLALACTLAGDCEMNFEPGEIIENGEPRTVFQLIPPSLRAPVGVTYQLFANRDDGSQTIHDFTFCLISVNESPVAGNDSFTLEQGEVIGRSTPSANLLQNDTDDIDTSNQASGLSVNTTAVEEPQFADQFELFEDGSFIYVPRAGRLGGDFFVYEISDGRTTPNRGTVTIVVTGANADPEFNGPIPAFPVVAGLPVMFSYADFFVDPEGAQLQFTASGLPPGLELTSDGELQGVPDAGSPGDYRVTISASDGRSTLQTTLEFSVAGNAPIETGLIPAQSVIAGDTFAFQAGQFFTDPEGQSIVYTLNRPADVALGIDRNTGLIAGIPQVSGTYLLQITASDGVSRPVIQTMVLEVEGADNNAPVFTGTLPNLIADLQESIVVLRPLFTDPDNDSLSYELLGDVPAGIIINPSTGAVSGTVEEAGEFDDLIVQAQDPDGLSATSNEFSITVLAPEVENSAPEYSGSIPNQQFTVGVEIEPFGGDFSDADGDTLEFSITGGTLPQGLTLSADGVIVGTPLRAGRVNGLRIVARDEGSAIARSDTFNITIEEGVGSIINRPPVFIPVQDRFVEVDEEIGFFIIANDPDADVLEYDLSGTAANFLSIDEDSGQIEGEFDRAGEFQAVVSASDGTAVTSISFEFTVDDPQVEVPESEESLEPNNDPTVTDIPNQVVSDSFSYDVSFVFEDPDGDTLTFTAVNLPAGVAIDEDGVITGTTTTANIGTHFIVVTASDGRGGTVSDGFRLFITN